MRLRNDGTVSGLLKDVPIPPMFHARLSFDRRHIERGDIPRAVFAAIGAAGVADRVRPGMTVAVTAGSRFPASR